MKYRVIFAPEAREDYLGLPAHLRSEVRDAINRHLQYEPQQVSRSRTKRLRATDRLHYRLRVGDVRVFYDVTGNDVEVLGIVEKSRAGEWLERAGE